MFGFFRRRRTLEQMLSDLAACGIAPRAGVSPEAMLRNAGMDRREIERGDFAALLIALGIEDYDEQAPETPRIWSDDVWHFDTECIEGDGDYLRIVRHLSRLARGALRFASVRDHVDIGAGVAWVETTDGSGTERLALRVQDDWVDEAIFALLQSRLVAAGARPRFAAHGLGQDMLLVCLEPRAIARLNRLTGLRFQEFPSRP